MPREPQKTMGILKYNNMESAAKALNGSNVVGKNSGYAVTHDTPKVTLDRKFHPHFDANNSPSQDDNDSATNSTSNSSFPEMKVWAKKETKTFLVPQYNSIQEIPNAQADASFSAGSSTTTAETSNYGGGVSGNACASVVQSNACIGAFHPCFPYNHNNRDSDDDEEQSNKSHLECTSNDYSYEDLCPEDKGKDNRRKVKATVSPFHVKHNTLNSQGLVEDSSNTMLNVAPSPSTVRMMKMLHFNPVIYPITRDGHSLRYGNSSLTPRVTIKG